MQLALLTPEQMPMSSVHKFESAGLGKAPFRCVGVSEERGPRTVNMNGVAVQVGAPGQPMGTCAYCGQGIAYCYQIQSADGKRFIVGSDCVEKTGDNGMIDLVKRAENKRKTARRHDTEAEKIKAGEPGIRAAIEANQDKLSRYPWRAEKGETLGDELEWLWKNSGTAGKLKLIKTWCK